MNISILGTGSVGRAHATRLLELGHTVSIGTRDPSVKERIENIPLLPFAESVRDATVVVNALKGDIALTVLSALKAELAGKILIDLANPLDFSNGMPPTLFVCNDDSLGEQIQRALPETHVVKAFNTLNFDLQVRPQTLANGDHDLFLCGNDADAKSVIVDIAKQYGWQNIHDLGDITNARGMEMLLPLWLRVWGAVGTAGFNVKIQSLNKR